MSDPTKFMTTCSRVCEARSYQITVRQQAAKIADLEVENKLRNIELGATQHAFTDYRASHAMKACMMCNSLERVHCYTNTEKLEAKILQLEAKVQSLMVDYCPEEMTRAQLDNWVESVKVVKPIGVSDD
jgi:hypothetical protein